MDKLKEFVNKLWLKIRETFRGNPFTASVALATVTVLLLVDYIPDIKVKALYMTSVTILYVLSYIKYRSNELLYGVIIGYAIHHICTILS